LLLSFPRIFEIAANFVHALSLVVRARKKRKVLLLFFPSGEHGNFAILLPKPIVIPTLKSPCFYNWGSHLTMQSMLLVNLGLRIIWGFVVLVGIQLSTEVFATKPSILKKSISKLSSFKCPICQVLNLLGCIYFTYNKKLFFLK